jgi:glutaredoxin-like YruB-family protein
MTTEQQSSVQAPVIHIYSTPTCHFCHLAKEFFTSHKIAYQDFDVSKDIDKRKEMVEKTGQLGVPVIEIDGKIIIGFDEATIVKMLSL